MTVFIARRPTSNTEVEPQLVLESVQRNLSDPLFSVSMSSVLASTWRVPFETLCPLVRAHTAWDSGADRARQDCGRTAGANSPLDIIT